MNIDDPTKGSCNLGDYTASNNDKLPNHIQDHDDSSGESYKDTTNQKRYQPLEPIQIR